MHRASTPIEVTIGGRSFGTFDAVNPEYLAREPVPAVFGDPPQTARVCPHCGEEIDDED